MNYRRFLGLMTFILPVASHSVTEERCELDVLPQMFNAAGSSDWFATDPASFALVWTTSISRLYEGIATVSPAEAEWINTELSSSGVGGFQRVLGSKTYAIWKTKADTAHLLVALRGVGGESRLDEQVLGWTRFARGLIDSDYPMYLAGLVITGDVGSDVVPEPWTMLHDHETTLETSIRYYSTTLARHVLGCILPQVLD